MGKNSIGYRRSDFLAMIFHFPTSAALLAGNVIRTAAIESKRTLRNGSLITFASFFFVTGGIFR